MAKLTLDNVTGGYDLSVINSNFDKIETAIENTVSRDGTLPNSMGAALDMNGNSVINATSVSAQSISINGEMVVANQTFVTELPSPIGQNGKILQSDGNAAFWSTDTPADLRSDLADVAQGDALIGVKLNATGSVSRTQDAKNAEIISVKDFGAVGDGVTDDTAAIQAAITFIIADGGSRRLYLPEGKYRCTTALTITRELTIEGEDVSPYVGGTGILGRGSWLYFDHTGKGININGGQLLGNVALRRFGTYRNQPVAAPGWTPNAHDYDIYIDNADTLLEDLMLLNPTKGVFLTNGIAGRLEANRVRGQAFQSLIRVDTSYDACKLTNIHQWPFWQDNANVHAYTEANLDALYFERCDNPMLSNIFTIFARSGIRFGASATGKTSKMHLVNADFDRGSYGIWVDATVTTGVTGQFDNITHQGETALAGSKGIFVQGNNSQLEFGNFRSDYAFQNAIRCDGTGNTLIFHSAPFVRNYDQQAANFPAIEFAVGNTCRINGLPDVSGAGGSGGKYGGAGTIYVDEWRSYTPTITAQTGTITTVGTIIGAYKLWNNTLDVAYDITITTNGTGAGAVQATLPYTAVTNNRVAVGREIALAGKMLNGYIASGGTNMMIRNYDNTYPGADGARLVINGSVRVA